MAAICEHVMSGHRVKLFIPTQGVAIAFSPSSVRCPARAQPGASGGRAEAEPFGEEAFAFTRNNVLQVSLSLGCDMGHGAECCLGEGLVLAEHQYLPAVLALTLCSGPEYIPCFCEPRTEWWS